MDENIGIDADVEEFGRHEARLIDDLRRAYAAVGILVGPEWDFRLRSLAAMNWSPNEEALFQDGGNEKLGRPSTRAPVEKVQRAIDALWAAMAECHHLRGREAGDRINVSATFGDLFAGSDERDSAFERFYTYANHIASAAREALETGQEPRTKPPNLLYDEFIVRVFSVASPAPAKLAPGKQIDLLHACEEVLPKAFRAPSKDAIKGRLAASKSRPPESPPGEVFDPAVHYGLSLDNSVVVDIAGKLRG